MFDMLPLPAHRYTLASTLPEPTATAIATATPATITITITDRTRNRPMPTFTPIDRSQIAWVSGRPVPRDVLVAQRENDESSGEESESTQGKSETDERSQLTALSHSLVRSDMPVTERGKGKSRETGPGPAANEGVTDERAAKRDALERECTAILRGDPKLIWGEKLLKVAQLYNNAEISEKVIECQKDKSTSVPDRLTKSKIGETLKSSIRSVAASRNVDQQVLREELVREREANCVSGRLYSSKVLRRRRNATAQPAEMRAEEEESHNDSLEPDFEQIFSDDLSLLTGERLFLVACSFSDADIRLHVRNFHGRPEPRPQVLKHTRDAIAVAMTSVAVSRGVTRDEVVKELYDRRKANGIVN